MWSFKKKIWKEIGREYLRTEYEINHLWPYEIKFVVYGVTYQDLISGAKKVKEVWNIE